MLTGHVFGRLDVPELQRLSVRYGNILAESTDAIVNAANGHLAHGGGLAGAIVRAGGRSIQQESDDLISRMGELPPGSAVHTFAGSLPFKYIIHAVGPVWHVRTYLMRLELFLASMGARI